MKSVGFKIIYILTAIIVVIELWFSVKGSLFTDIAELPVGTQINSYSSPSGEKNMNVFLVKNNLGCAVRCEIETQDTKYNIFWQTGIESVDVVWLNNDEVAINKIPLNANDKFGYDCRRGYSLFDEGSLEQNFMNEQ